MSEETGLRERKKAATRAALSDAATQLAREHGVESVTTDAIAAAANVAPRTFRNYFSSKEDAIVAPLLAHAGSLAGLLRRRPAGEPVWDALRNASIELLTTPSPELAGLSDRLLLIKSSPALIAQHLCVFEEVERMLAEAIGERTGLPAGDPYPRLQSGVAVLALRTGLDLWIGGTAHDELGALVAKIIDYVRAGLPEPSPDARPVLSAR